MAILKDKSVSVLYDSVREFVKDINDKKVSKAILSYLDKYFHAFVASPGSINHHHNYTGGLVEHTLEVILLSLHIAEMRELIDLNRDKLIISSVIHDIGKIKQYTMEGSKWIYAMNKEESKVFDHGMWVLEDFKNVTGIILSPDIIEAIATHHGGWSKTGVQMKAVLSAVLHSADLISSRI
jgi:3'-5' exoribonuclease